MPWYSNYNDKCIMMTRNGNEGDRDRFADAASPRFGEFEWNELQGKMRD